jgi:hypothetical protein
MDYVKINEKSFYEKIVKLPYMSNSYFKLFQDINYEYIVEDLLVDFRTIYLPIISEFKNNFIYFDKESENFVITNTRDSRRFFAENLNYEVIKCMHLILKHCNFLLKISAGKI